MRRKLELLLGAIPAAPEDQSTRRDAARQVEVAPAAVPAKPGGAGGSTAEIPAPVSGMAESGDSPWGRTQPSDRLGGLLGGGGPGGGTGAGPGAVAGPGGDHRARVAAAGGELLGAAFRFLGELVSQQTTTAPPDALVGALRDGLGQCVEPGEDGRSVLKISLPDTRTLDGLARTLARLMVPAAPAGATERYAALPEGGSPTHSRVP